MKTTISIHVPLTQKVLEGIKDEDSCVVVHRIGYVSQLSGRGLKGLKEDYTHILIERTFTDEEIEKERDNWFSWAERRISPNTLKYDKDYIKLAMKEFVNWALSIPKQIK